MLNFSFPAKPVFFGALITLVSAVATLNAAEVTPPVAPRSATPIITSDEAVQKNLVALDRLLDVSNPKLEETLRKNIDQLDAGEFRKTNPEIDVVLTEQPWIVSALKVERHFLIHRYVAHRARGPLLRPDIVAFDNFLSAHREIGRALDNDPAQILEASFLVTHPSLGKFFDQHPNLSTVLLEKQQARLAPIDG